MVCGMFAPYATRVCMNVGGQCEMFLGTNVHSCSQTRRPEFCENPKNYTVEQYHTDIELDLVLEIFKGLDIRPPCCIREVCILMMVYVEKPAATKTEQSNNNKNQIGKH